VSRAQGMGPEFEHIVVGGGISGLGMAHLSARRGVPTLVLEGSDRIGGSLHSRTAAGCGDFWVEAGSHSCFNSYGHLLDILGDLGLTARLTPKAKLGYRLWRDKARTSLVGALHPFELAGSLPRLFTASKENKGVAAYYGALLGRRNYRDLAGPAFRAVICQDADDFPAELLFRPKPRRKGIPRSFTLPGGLAEIPHALAAQPRLRVRTLSPAIGVAQDGEGYRVRLADGSAVDCRRLTLAVPPDAAAALLPPALEDLLPLVAGIGIAHIETLVLWVPAAELSGLPPLAGLIAVDDAFFSMVSRDYLPDPGCRGFAFHFRPGALDPDAQVERACEALGIRPERVASLARVDNRLPALRVGHRELVRRIDARLAGGNLAVTGNWFLGVSIEDCLARTHQEFGRLFAG